MFKLLTSLLLASVILTGCGPDGLKTVTYGIVELTCDVGGEKMTSTFTDDENIYHRTYIHDTKINIEVRDRNTGNIIKDIYWTNLPQCQIIKTSRKIVIESTTEEK